MEKLPYDTNIEIDDNLRTITADYNVPEEDINDESISENYKAYLAVYDENNALVSVKSEAMTTADKTITYTLPADGKSYSFKSLLWDGMTPLCETADSKVQNAGKIQSSTYSFAEDVTASDGYENQGDVLEWNIASAPQMFYIDTVEADKIDSIEIRAGYQTGNAKLSFYLYDGNDVSVEKLKAWCADASELGEPIAAAADSNSSTWGYRTAKITASGITIADSDNYTADSAQSKALAVSSTGKKALIMSITGNIGSKAYFDNIKINYKELVDVPIKAITQ